MSNFINELTELFFDEISQYDYSELVEEDICGTIELKEYDQLINPYIIFSINEKSVEVNLYHGESGEEEAQLDEKEELEKEFTSLLNSFLETIIIDHDDEHQTTDIKKLKCIENVIGENGETFCTAGKVYEIINRYVCLDEFSFIIIDDKRNEHYFSVTESEMGTTYKDWFIAA